MIRPSSLHSWIAFSLSLLLSEMAYSQITPIESAIETNVTEVTLPQSSPSTIYSQSCPQCKTQTLQTDATTQYFVGKTAVSLPDLNKFVKAQAADPPTMTIYYKRADANVTRIVVNGVLVLPPKSSH